MDASQFQLPDSLIAYGRERLLTAIRERYEVLRPLLDELNAERERARLEGERDQWTPEERAARLSSSSSS